MEELPDATISALREMLVARGDLSEEDKPDIAALTELLRLQHGGDHVYTPTRKYCFAMFHFAVSYVAYDSDAVLVDARVPALHKHAERGHELLL